MSTASATRTFEGTAVPEAGTYDIDASHSHVGFAVRHLMVSKVRGSFGSFSGSLTVGDDPTQSSVEVSIDTASIDTGDEQRDGHLRSPDFFDAERYPTLTYRSTKVTHEGRDRWAVEGDLTIGEVTRSVPLTVTFEGASQDPWGGSRIGFSAETKINREDFGLTWNQALETGGVLVGKDIKVEIEVEAVRQA